MDLGFNGPKATEMLSDARWCMSAERCVSEFVKVFSYRVTVYVNIYNMLTSNG